MEKIIVTDLLWIVNPIAERVSASTELADSFAKLTVAKRVKAFDKALATLGISEYKDFTNNTTWEVVKIMSSDKAIRRLVDVPSANWNVSWFIKVFSDSNMQFSRWKFTRNIGKLSATWEIIKLK